MDNKLRKETTVAESRSDSTISVSPFRILAIIIASIFAAEVVAMIAVYFLPPLPYALLTIIDAGIMVAMIFPFLYVFSFRPLTSYITMQHQTEQTLLQKEELLEKYFNSIDSTIAYMDRDFNFIKVNDAYAGSSNGRPPEFFVGKNHFAMFPNQENEAIFRNVVDTGEAYTVYEKAFEYADQPERGVTYWDWSLQPVKNQVGTVEGVVLSLVEVTERKRAQIQLRQAYDELELRVQERTEELARVNDELVNDITERKKIEEALRKSEERLRIVTEMSPVQFSVSRASDDVILYVNSAYENAFGYSKEELIGSRAPVLYEDPGDRVTLLNALNEQGFVRDYEVRVKRKNGTPFWVSISVATIDYGGEPAFLGASLDITERKRAEQALRQAKEEWERTFDAVPDLIAILDEEYRILRTNKAMADRMGMDKEKCIGQLCFEHVHGMDHPPQSCPHLLTCVDGKEHLAEILEPRLGGSFLVSDTPFFDTQGQLIGSVHVARDITKLKEAEEQIRSLAKFPAENPNPVIRMASDGTISYANPPGQALLETWQCSVGQPVCSPLREIALKAGSPPTKFAVDTTIGERIYSILVAPIPEMGYTNVYGLDITARVQAQQALKQAHDELEIRVQERTRELAAKNEELVAEIAERREVEGQLRIRTTALEAAGNGIIITDIGGMILWANPAFLNMSGYSKDEVIGKTPHILASGKHDQNFYQNLWQTILRGDTWRGEITNRHKDGTLYVEEETITPVRIGEGGISHFIAIKQDITYRKQAELALEQRNRELLVLSTAEHKQRQLAETLLASAQALARSLDLDTVLGILLKHIRSLVGSDTASAIFSEGETLFGVRAVLGYENWIDPNQILAIKIDSEANPLFQEVVSNRKHLLIPDTAEEPAWAALPGPEFIRNYLLVPMEVEGKIIGLVGLGKTEVGFFNEEHVQWAEALVGQAAAAIQNAWLFEQVRAGRERLQYLSRRLVEIQETERRFIARELHDHAGQTLTSLILGLGALEKEATKSQFIQNRVSELKGMTSNVLEDLHRLAVNLRPASLDHLGLVPALEQLVKSMMQDSPLQIKFKAVGIDEDERLPQEMETALYRIAQEALTNVVRHARASRVDIMLERQEGSALILVEDDGIGFDVDLAKKSGHLGLLGMQERAEMLGGRLTIESVPGRGTTAVVEVPYAN